MAHLAIKGHPTRGKEVIEILETLGGINSSDWECNSEGLYYSIGIDCLGKGGVIIAIKNDMPDYMNLTLEEFLEKYPYKVGDKVRIPEYESEIRILSMTWDGYEVQYEVFTDETEWYSAKELNEYNKHYKEEEMEEEGILTIDFTKDPRIANEVEVILGDYEFVLKDGKTYFVKKKPQYPKTYEECCDILGGNNTIHVKELILFKQLINARNAYWKIAGDWKEKRKEKAMHYVIYSTLLGEVVKDTMPNCIANYLLDFPTAEMRDAFYENFKELIEQCKELL